MLVDHIFVAHDQCKRMCGAVCGRPVEDHEVSVAGGAGLKIDEWRRAAVAEIQAAIDSFIHGDAPTFQQALLYWTCRAWAIMIEKQRQRGPGNIIEQGEVGVLNRMIRDKGARLLRQARAEEFRRQAVEEYGMTGPQVDPVLAKFLTGESFQDDVLDVANYSMLLLMLRDDQLRLPCVLGDPASEVDWITPWLIALSS